MDTILAPAECGLPATDYAAFLRAVADRFAATAVVGPLFRTDAAGLFDAFLAALPDEMRPVHRCDACRRFIRRFGGLAVVRDDGALVSPLWATEDGPAPYQAALRAMAARVGGARVVAAFHARETVWGRPVTGPWTHLAVVPPPDVPYRGAALTPGEAMAESRHRFENVARALADFPPALLDQALRALAAEALDRSGRFVGPVRWLRDLHDRPKGRRGENLLWRAVATAPEGHCHPRASVVAPLLEDIAAGLPFDAVRARFAAKVAPDRYRRPQAPPAEATVKEAEALVARLGLAPSLRRRRASRAEVPTVWVPRPAGPPPGGGVFAAVPTRPARDAVPALALPERPMTWARFAHEVLPAAARLRVLVPHGPVAMMAGVTTAEVAGAPPLLTWDREDERNPLCWYVHQTPGGAGDWGLVPGGEAEVTGVALLPNLLGSRPMPHLISGVLLLLEGARDRRAIRGNALFPEALRAELHGIRAVIEAYAATATLGDANGEPACGWLIEAPHGGVRLRALVGGAWDAYRIDRWA